MSWQELEPIVKTSPRVKVAIVAFKSGVPQMRITLSESFFKELGHPKRAKVQAGHGELAGKVRILFDQNGKFEVKPYAKGGAVITMAAWAGLPTKPVMAEPCEVESHGVLDGVGPIYAVIVLPMDTWARIMAHSPTKAAPKAATATKPVDETAPDNKHIRGTVRIIPYLQNRGRKVEASLDGFVVDNEPKTKQQVVNIINHYRKQSNKLLLTMSDCI